MNYLHPARQPGNHTLQFAAVPPSPKLEDKTERTGKTGRAMAPHPHLILSPARPGPAAEQTHKLGQGPDPYGLAQLISDCVLLPLLHIALKHNYFHSTRIRVSS